MDEVNTGRKENKTKLSRARRCNNVSCLRAARVRACRGDYINGTGARVQRKCTGARKTMQRYPALLILIILVPALQSHLKFKQAATYIYARNADALHRAPRQFNE